MESKALKKLRNQISALKQKVKEAESSIKKEKEEIKEKQKSIKEKQKNIRELSSTKKEIQKQLELLENQTPEGILTIKKAEEERLYYAGLKKQERAIVEIKEKDKNPYKAFYSQLYSLLYEQLIHQKYLSFLDLEELKDYKDTLERLQLYLIRRVDNLYNPYFPMEYADIENRIEEIHQYKKAIDKIISEKETYNFPRTKDFFNLHKKDLYILEEFLGCICEDLSFHPKHIKPSLLRSMTKIRKKVYDYMLIRQREQFEELEQIRIEEKKLEEEN